MAVAKMQSEATTTPSSKQNIASFAKLLAGNDKKIRDKGLKKLRSWLTLRSSGNFVFTEEDLMTIWAGLYYSMWMSDMPLIQEDLAESISSLIWCFGSKKESVLAFIKCFLMTISQAWQGLDQFRVDKFSMFVRRFVRQSLLWLAKDEWKLHQVKQLMQLFLDHVLAEKVALGFKLHFIDIFPEELSKASKGELTTDVMLAVLEPFAQTAALTADGRVRMQCEIFFRHLIKQTDLALEYEDKFNAWKRAGCPGGNLNLMVPEDEDSEDDEEDETNSEAAEPAKPAENGELDPRAGSVHVELPQIQLPAKQIANMMNRVLKLPQASVKGRRLMLNLSRKFKKLDKGKYPFAVGKVCDDEKLNMRKMIAESLKSEVSDVKKRLKNRKEIKMRKKRRLSLDVEEALPTTTDVEKKKKKTSGNKINNGKSSVSKTNKKDEGSPRDRKTLNMTNQVGSGHKRKAKKAFVVTTDTDPVPISPVGAKKRTNSDEYQLELPPGWIVESCEGKTREAPKVKGDWLVMGEPVALANPVPSPPVNGHVAPEVVQPSPSPKTSPVKQKTSPSSPMKTSPTGAKHHKKTEEGEQRTQDDGERTINIASRPNPSNFVAHALAKLNKKMKTPSNSPAADLAKATLEAVSASKSGRRVSINTSLNKAQEKVEWIRQLHRSPQIPFDAARTPTKSALKKGLPPTPINPFYARELGLYTKT